MKTKRIELRKQMSNLSYKAEQGARPPFCLNCGEAKSLCNSHIVPRFILKTIADKGMVCYGYSLVERLDDIIDSKKGINNAFNFFLICSDCDKKLFAHYEDPKSILEYESLDDKSQKTVLIEMAIKTHFAHIYRKAKTYGMNSMLYPEEIKMFQEIGHKTAYELDIEDHQQYLRNLSDSREDPDFDFEVLYNKLLDYEVGIATQTVIAYIFDLKGRMLFNPHDFTTGNLTRYFYLMILPINGKTRVLFYIERKYTPIVKSIIEQFKTLTEEEKLHFLFISLIVYEEQFYINPLLLNEMKTDKKLCKLFIQADSERRGATKNCKRIKYFRKYSNYLLNKNSQ